MPGWILERPDLITVEKIKAETDLEVRRVMIEKYGPGRFLKDAGAVLIHSDNLGLRGSSTRALFKDAAGGSWLVGSDGSTGRVYFMAAPREAKTCREAHETMCGFDETTITEEC